jgi:hypothetical protein
MQRLSPPSPRRRAALLCGEFAGNCQLPALLRPPHSIVLPWIRRNVKFCEPIV